MSVVVPTWQRAPFLDRCLTAIEAQSPAPDEVVVVGRDVDEPAREMVERHRSILGERLRWASVDRPGHVAPVRAGLAAASGDLVAFVDDDAEPREGWLERLTAPFSEPAIGCVGGGVETPGHEARPRADSGTTTWFGKHVGNVASIRASGLLDTDGVMECNWAWRTRLLKQLEFDARLDFHDASMYGLDLCLQAKRRGYRVVYVPDAMVTHHAAPRDPALDRDRAEQMRVVYGRNYTIVAARNLRGLQRLAFWPWWFVVGERASYGLLTGAVDLVRRGWSVWPLVRGGFRGKWLGVRECMRAR